ncbi:uncharacterized protein LOC119431858 [Dermacentor silvarum]|uniref:uncharacterized protein LOC119431858 n=1 Tax=Dermacentor silvarum TaxID=543639 RepID=UPI00210138EC|nr:uncharacterized protein LOC119431858 [Dermacentor silvarum]
MKLAFAVAVLVTLVALTVAHKDKGKHGKGKTKVVVVDAYPERRPVYDYPAPRPSYDYGPTYAEYVEVPLKVKKKKPKKSKKQKVTIVQARPSYDYYDYGNSYNNYDDYEVVPKIKKTKHIQKTYRQYREPVYYDEPKKGELYDTCMKLSALETIPNMFRKIKNLNLIRCTRVQRKLTNAYLCLSTVKEAYPVPVEVPVYRDRIQKVPVYQNVPYPVYVQPQRHYAPPQPVYHHMPKQVYHHQPRPVYHRK